MNYSEVVCYLHRKEFIAIDTNDFKFDKFAANSMIGSFKPKLKETWKSIAINDNANSLFHYYLKHPL